MDKQLLEFYVEDRGDHCCLYMLNSKASISQILKCDIRFKVTVDRVCNILNATQNLRETTSYEGLVSQDIIAQALLDMEKSGVIG